MKYRAYFIVQNIRGLGTFAAFDLEDAAKRDKLVNELRILGVESGKLFSSLFFFLCSPFLIFHIGGCGVNSLRLRPMLVCTPRHIAQFLERLDTVLAKL